MGSAIALYLYALLPCGISGNVRDLAGLEQAFIPDGLDIIPNLELRCFRLFLFLLRLWQLHVLCAGRRGLLAGDGPVLRPCVKDGMVIDA